MGKIKDLLHNKWVGFSLAALLYTLWFVVWTGNLWMLLGLPVIFDLYITKFFYRYVWSHNAKMCQRSKTYKTVYEWVNAIIFATVVATLVHIFVFQMYVIPTSSMERTLLIGDYLYVSKVTYGPQMPNTPLSFPFVHHTMPFSQTKKSFSEAIKWPYHRLKGLKPIRRNDVVVFNFPAGDTVLLENQNVTYYDTLRSFEESFGKTEGRKRLNEKYTVISRPVDKRENYIKRCVGIPGDSLEVRNGQVWVNGEPQEPIPGTPVWIWIRNIAILCTLFEPHSASVSSNNGACPCTDFPSVCPNSLKRKLLSLYCLTVLREKFLVRLIQISRKNDTAEKRNVIRSRMPL